MVFGIIISYRYMYTDDVTLTVDTVLDCLHTSRKYCLDGLVQRCSDFLEQSLSAVNACSIYEQAKLYDMASLEEQSLDYILYHPLSSFKSKEFREISQETLISILESSKLGSDEESNFKAALYWAEHQCCKNNVCYSLKNVHHYLGDALFQIRFPLIPIDVFAKKIVTTGILNSEEQLALFKYMATKQTAAQANVGKFICLERDKNRIVTVLQNEYKPDKRCSLNSDSALAIECSSDVNLEEIKGLPGSSFVEDIEHIHDITFLTGIRKEEAMTTVVLKPKDWKLRDGSIVFSPHLVLHTGKQSFLCFRRRKPMLVMGDDSNDVGRSVRVCSRNQISGVRIFIRQIPRGLESIMVSV